MLGEQGRLGHHVLSIELACYHAVQDYPGGVVAVASVYGWNASTLQNRLNPNTPTHKITAQEIRGILELTRDKRILDAVCLPIDVMWLDLQRLAPGGDMAILDNVTALVQQVGELCGKVQDSLADGKVDRGEAQELEESTVRLVQAAYTLLERSAQFQES